MLRVMVFVVQTFRERLGVRNHFHHSAAPVPAMPDGPIVRNRRAHCVGLATKLVERSNIWFAEEPLCQRYFVRSQIGIVEERLG
jgi:hypothetical protein